jgi:G3E family GTPase
LLYFPLIIYHTHHPYKEDGQGESLLDIATIDSMVTVIDAVNFMKDIQVP